MIIIIWKMKMKLEYTLVNVAVILGFQGFYIFLVPVPVVNLIFGMLNEKKIK